MRRRMTETASLSLTLMAIVHMIGADVANLWTYSGPPLANVCM